MLTDDTLVALGLQKHLTVYRREGKSSDTFTAVDEPQLTPADLALVRQATAIFQAAYRLYESRSYVIPDNTAPALSR